MKNLNFTSGAFVETNTGLVGMGWVFDPLHDSPAELPQLGISPISIELEPIILSSINQLITTSVPIINFLIEHNTDNDLEIEEIVPNLYFELINIDVPETIGILSFGNSDLKKEEELFGIISGIIDIYSDQIIEEIAEIGSFDPEDQETIINDIYKII
jgi:hypothetical protein